MAKWWRSAASNLRTVVANGPASQPSSSYHTIQAVPRECSGSRVSARDRAQGRIPAVVLSQQLLFRKDVSKNSSDDRSLSRKRLLTTERKQIQAILKSVDLPFFYCTTFPLQIRAGSGSSHLLESGTVLPIKASQPSIPSFNLNFLLFYLLFSYFFIAFMMIDSQG